MLLYKQIQTLPPAMQRFEFLGSVGPLVYLLTLVLLTSVRMNTSFSVDLTVFLIWDGF